MQNTINTCGKCLCGAVTYQIDGTPLRMAQCHCEHCRRASGTGHMSLAFFQEADVKVQGETASYASNADSGNINTRYFCPQCGGRLFGKNSGRPGLIAVTAGSLDDSTWFSPQVIVYAAARPQWDKVDDSIESFDAMS